MIRWKENIEKSVLDEEKRKMKILCPNCGHRIHFYAFEKKNMQLCKFCGIYVFPNKNVEFKYRLKEKMHLLKRNDR